uniref:Uncharacterized protein n=1 Tax=Glossina palpalis gambiensis TaxID=67801 RepID=A0A1B0BPP6_9MUSC
MQLVREGVSIKVISPHFLTAKFIYHQVDHHHHHHYYHHHHRQSLWTAKLSEN